MKRFTHMLLITAMLAFTLVAVVASPVVSQPTQVKAQEGLKICFAFQDLETEFWVAGHKAITETLRNQGIEVIEVNGNQDANRQLEQVRDCIAQGVDGIILIPRMVKALSRSLAKQMMLMFRLQSSTVLPQKTIPTTPLSWLLTTKSSPRRPLNSWLSARCASSKLLAKK